MTADFSVTTRHTPTGPVLRFAGELNAATAPDALEAISTLTPQPGQQLVVDLAGLRFWDSSGLATLIAARNLALATDARIALAAVPPQLARTLGIIGLADLFTTYPSAEDA